MIDTDEHGNVMSNLNCSYLGKFCLRLYLYILALCFNLEISLAGGAEHIINTDVSPAAEEFCLRDNVNQSS